jgi:hypothetical protein
VGTVKNILKVNDDGIEYIKTVPKKGCRGPSRGGVPVDLIIVHQSAMTRRGPGLTLYHYSKPGLRLDTHNEDRDGSVRDPIPGDVRFKLV